ncbi:MAG: iron chelate uptake ABC transporter family permease subunit [Halobacteriota archaeon]
MASHSTTRKTTRTPAGRALGWSLGLAGALCLTAVYAAGVGSLEIPRTDVAAIVLQNALENLETIGIEAPTLHAGPDYHETVVLDIRLPRVAVGATAGFALGAAGAVMQGFFRNPMADPTIVGVSSGAAVGAVAVIALAIPVNLHLAAFAGALVTAFGVYALATHDGRTGVADLLLAGVAVQMFLGAVVSLMIYTSDDHAMRTAVYWLMGNLSHQNWSEFAVSAPVVAVGFAVMMHRSAALNLLAVGERQAHTLGVDVDRTRDVLLAVSSLVTAAAVAVVGVVGFVGLVVPHAMRLVVGPDHRVLVPASAVGGATFLVGVDGLARDVTGGGELPIGVVTALAGVPFFLYLLRKRGAYDL